MSPGVMLDGLVRRLVAQGRREERERILDDLGPRLLRAEEAHHLSKEGRLADGIRLARDLVQPGPASGDDGMPWREYLGRVNSAVDGVEVGVYIGEPIDDGDRYDEAWPIRVRLVDGAGPVIADAFLTIDEGDELVALLQQALARAREVRCLTPAELDDREGADRAGGP